MVLAFLFNTVTTQGVFLPLLREKVGLLSAVAPWRRGLAQEQPCFPGVAGNEARGRSIERALTSPLTYAIMSGLFLGAGVGPIQCSESTRAYDHNPPPR